MAAAIVWIAQRLPVEARVHAAALVCAVMIPFGVNVARHDRHLQRRGLRAAAHSRGRGSRVADAGKCRRAVGAAQRQRAVLRATESRCDTTGCRTTSSTRPSRSGGEGLSTLPRRRRLGSRKSSRRASRRPAGWARSTGRPWRACPAAQKCASSRCRTGAPRRTNEEEPAWCFSPTAPSRSR